MAITVITAAESNNLTKLETVKLHLGITDNSQDMILDELITMISNQVEVYCNRKFGKRTIKETLAGDGSLNLTLKHWPIRSITHVKLSDVTVSSSLYSLQEPEKGYIFNRDGWTYTGQEFLYEVQYEHGYVLPSFTTGTRDLPYDLELAVVSVIKQAYYNMSNNPNIQSESVSGVYSVSYRANNLAQGGGAFPADALQVLNRYRVFNL